MLILKKFSWLYKICNQFSVREDNITKFPEVVREFLDAVVNKFLSKAEIKDYEHILSGHVHPILRVILI